MERIVEENLYTIIAECEVQIVNGVPKGRVVSAEFYDLEGLKLHHVDDEDALNSMEYELDQEIENGEHYEEVERAFELENERQCELWH